MNEEEALRQRKLEELTSKAQKQKGQESQNEQKINMILNRFLTEEARLRLTNVRLVKRDLFESALSTILMLAQQGRLEGKLTDEDLKMLLERLSQKRDFTIRRK